MVVGIIVMTGHAVLYAGIFQYCYRHDWWDWLRRYRLTEIIGSDIAPVLTLGVMMVLTILVVKGWEASKPIWNHIALLLTTFLMLLPQIGIFCSLISITMLFTTIASRIAAHHDNKKATT